MYFEIAFLCGNVRIIYATLLWMLLHSITKYVVCKWFNVDQSGFSFLLQCHINISDNARSCGAQRVLT